MPGLWPLGKILSTGNGRETFMTRLNLTMAFCTETIIPHAKQLLARLVCGACLAFPLKTVANVSDPVLYRPKVKPPVETEAIPFPLSMARCWTVRSGGPWKPISYIF